MKEGKVIIFDASTLIGFAMNGMCEEIKLLKGIFNGRFIIPHEVKSEIIDKPLTIKRFELQALKLKDLLDTGILETPEVFGINGNTISMDVDNLMSKANSMFTSKNREVRLIDLGETACLAVSKILTEKGIDNILAVDERTTRVLCEKPQNLQALMQRKLRAKVDLKREYFKDFKGFRFIRSTELAYIAYKKKLVRLKGEKVLDAMLWALKTTGCAIDSEDINKIKQIDKKGLKAKLL